MIAAASHILITGATGNIGIEVLKSLQKSNHQLQVVAGVRNLKSDAIKLAGYTIELVKFDFTNVASYKPVLQNCNTLFLLRPPQIANIDAYFKPLITAAKECGVIHIIFLSVQGVQHNKWVPHHKIEKLIIESGIPFIFLRPAYFMQNFTPTLQQDLFINHRIFLQAGGHFLR